MDDHSFHEKEGFNDNSIQHRLSESRPKFKPVLVKKLLADESDDDSDDQTPNSDNSDEEFDDFDGFQPLSDEGADNAASKTTLVTKTEVQVDIAVNEEAASASASIANTVEKIEVPKASDSSHRNKETEQKSVLNSYLKDSLKISDYVVRKSDEDKLISDKPIAGAKRKSVKDSNDPESATLQSQWQPKPATILDKRKSSTVKDQSELNVKPSYSPDSKRHSNNSFVNPDSQEHRRYSFTNVNKPHSIANEASDEKASIPSRRYSFTNVNKPSIANETSDEKALIPSKMPVDQLSSTKGSGGQPVSSASGAPMDTPMKHPQGSTRPNPCLSHRNIFQTPQNKMGNEFAKNSIQTPATIFSHWSQQHMAQTPMQSQISSSRESREPREPRESMQTPATSISQSQSSRHETPRYFTGENKSVRRPLAETMYSGPVHGPQLPRLPEAPNESQPSPPIPRESSNAVRQESLQEKKPVYSSSQTTHETKENRNPNPHDIIKNDSHLNNQPKSSVAETRHSINSHTESKPKLEYQNNAYNNVQPQRKVETYENYQARESKNAHPPITSQAEQIQNIQCTIPQQSNPWNSRQNKIITVKDRQYLVLGVLGQGMSCEVVRAQDLSSSELRAIKCVNLSKMDKDSAQGCLQEICMLDRLKAPCIVHMFNFEIKQPWVHVVMEVGDTDLSRLLKSMLQEKKQIPLTMILYYWTEMLTAVKHIHENGVIHSDLKPANFLLVRGRLKLIDFGIASNINSDMTSVVKNCPIGTLNYISPEALLDVNTGSTDSPNHSNKFKISYKSDVWSLGCILYGLVYGVTPFNHIRQQWAKISAITDPKHKINFPLKTGTEPVPLILIDVMRKCLQRDAKARPTVADLLDIPYLQSNISPPVVPTIPSNIMMKIKHALSDEEFKKLAEILESKWKP